MQIAQDGAAGENLPARRAYFGEILMMTLGTGLDATGMMELRLVRGTHF
jgi:hypothetical protein